MGLKNTKNLKGVLLDLDGTLYSYPKCDQAGRDAVFKYLSSRLGVPEQKVKKAYLTAREKIHHRLDGFASSHSRFLYIQSCLESLTGTTKSSLTLGAETVFWKAFFAKMELNKGVKEFLGKAKKKNLKIAIISDLTSKIQFKKITRLNIWKYVDFIVTSEEAGREKPHPDIFELALHKIKLKPTQVLMVGDSLTRDILGARRVGIRAVRTIGEATLLI